MRLAFSFRFFGVSICPQQIECEMVRLGEFVSKRKPKCVVEIGTAEGGTLFSFSKVSTPDAILLSIDLRDLRVRRLLYESFGSDGQQIRLIRGDSQANATLGEVKRLLNGRRIDFLFIDGDHTYEGVKRDFELYSPLVLTGGVVAFHDIVRFPPTEAYEEVNQFWEKIRRKYDGFEIVNNPNQVWAGIGVIQIP